MAGLTYKDAGVDIDAGSRAVQLMKAAVEATHGPAVLGGLGAFGGLFSASAFGMSLRMRPQDIDFEKGRETMRSWDTRGDDGEVKRCCFCPNCGTRIMHGSDDPTESVSIKAGTLDDTSGLRPGAHIWLRSAQPWVTIDRERYACFDTEPDDGMLAGENREPEPKNG